MIKLINGVALIVEWWTDIDGMNKKEVQAKLIRSGFDSKKVKRASDDSLYTLYSIAKRRGELKKEAYNNKKLKKKNKKMITTESSISKSSTDSLLKIWNQAKDEKVSGTYASRLKLIAKELRKRKVSLEGKDIEETTTTGTTAGSEEYNTPNAFSNSKTDKKKRERKAAKIMHMNLVKEEITSSDWNELKKLIRMEIALLFFDLYKKRNVWI